MPSHNKDLGSIVLRVCIVVRGGPKVRGIVGVAGGLSWF
jgi:hypothetical protein